LRPSSLKKIIKLLCVSAATNERAEVDLSDVFLLKDCLWNHQDNRQKVRDLILNTLQQLSRQVPLNEAPTLANADDGIPTYEVAEDGKTLVIAQVVGQSQALTVQSQTQSSAIGKMNAVVKGMKGSGTAQDPLLIGSVAEFSDLVRPDVGVKGYHFRQTADIDLSALSTYPEIPFQGHYDGAGYTIKHKVSQSAYSEVGFFAAALSVSQSATVIFTNILTQSSIKNLKLNASIANVITGTHITHCTSTGILIQEDAQDSTFTFCQSGSSLVWETAANCTFSDCLVVGEWHQNIHRRQQGGIARTLDRGSVVERCFVTGVVNSEYGSSNFHFSIITSDCNASTICHCGLGRLKKNHQMCSCTALVTGIETPR
jgi:MoxR-like ATPase